MYYLHPYYRGVIPQMGNFGLLEMAQPPRRPTPMPPSYDPNPQQQPPKMGGKIGQGQGGMSQQMQQYGALLEKAGVKGAGQWAHTAQWGFPSAVEVTPAVGLAGETGGLLGGSAAAEAVGGAAAAGGSSLPSWMTALLALL